MSNTMEKNKEFRSSVLGLKNLNPSWQAPEIANFIQESENRPSLKRRQLLTKIRRVLRRNTINDKQRSGRPVTIRTPVLQQKVKSLIKLKKGASIRNVTSILNQKGIICSPKTVHRTTRQLKLKWFKTKKSQKLTDINKVRRVICAKQLRMQFGIMKSAKKWKWNRIVNTDFSGKFTLHPFQNKKNDGFWAEEGEHVPSSIANAPTDKFPKELIFWGAISSRGLIPIEGPINLTRWLRQQQSKTKKNMKTYLTSDLYAKFLNEEVEPSIKQAFQNTSLIPIFQDDQDGKHRTKIVMNTVEDLFEERIDPEVGDAKFADVWPIERVWGAIKEKLRGKTFANELELENQVIQVWKTFTPAKCEQMMEKIPFLLQQVIDLDGEQTHKH